MDIFNQLFTNLTVFELNQWLIEEIPKKITLKLCSKQTLVDCPRCYHPTQKIHSYYERTLSDLTWADYNLCLKLKVRKFFCRNQGCNVCIFTERLKNFALPWARRTIRLSNQLTAIALELGGSAGARLANYSNYQISRNTLLELIRRIPLPPITTPSILGVDDFAFRKRKTYGTILVDLEKGRPITLLPDREAETLSKWLKEHLGIQVVSRDRSKAYEKGINEGAPDAIQVADRFHLFQNLAETLDQIFCSHAKVLKFVQIDDAKLTLTPKNEETKEAVFISPPPQEKLEKSKASARRDKRLAIYEQIQTLRDQGLSSRAIGESLGIGVTTVFRYLRHTTFPERQGRSDKGRSLLDPYKDYILARWNGGCHDTKRLFEEIQELGYSLSYDTVARYTRRLRYSQGIPLRQRLVKEKKSLPIVSEPSKRIFTPGRARDLVLRRDETRDAEGERLLNRLKAANPELKEAIELAQDFASIVRQRQPEKFDVWLDRARKSTVSLFRRFAAGLDSDYKAVKAGITLETNNGPVEGHVNRLKMLKRQMYGRAGLDLLTRRFLLNTENLVI
ncbi:MAG: ISL3 family transposase ISAcma23 (plasmid) [Chroococcopsis gigantea SAG 12.99]|nr:ISL3 family transposase ISAcma23 [Chroococcopsis gigantea SAG 12.99]